MNVGIMPNNNFQMNADLVLRDVYRLVLLVAADAGFLGLYQNQDDPLMVLRDCFQEDEFVHGLVSIAVSNRIQLDHMGSQLGPENDCCGKLQENVLNEGFIDLNFREACNKIIHAIHIVAEVAGDPAVNPIGTTIELRGTKNGQAWQAQLDLIEYARATVKNFRRLG